MFPDPNPVDIELYFQALTQVDNSDLTPLTLFAGSTTANYSNQTELGFTLSRDGYNIEVAGTGFVYDAGVPTSGSVDWIDARVGNATMFTLYGDPLPLATFLTTDPQALATTLFSADDIINGSSLDDTLYGFDGDDIMGGSAGADLMYGGNGDDQLGGGDGDDKLYGDAGDDWLGGGKGNDKLFGGQGSDTATFTDKLAGVDVKLKGAKTAKAHIGTSEVDKLKGIENVLGGLGKDKITGDGGDNKLAGYAGDDVLKGKGGDDLLVGGWGSDTLTGGKGADIFLFDKIPAGHSFTDIDTITDFGKGGDSLHFLQGLYGNLNPGVLSPEHFYAAPGAFAGIGETYFVYDTKNGILYYDGSGDGSSPVFQVAVLKGSPTLTAKDIFIDAPLDLIN